MKRILIILLFALVILSAGYYFLMKPGAGFSGDTSAFRAVPIDAPLFIEFPSLSGIPSDNEAVKGLFRSGILNHFSVFTSRIDSLITGTEAIGNALRNTPFIVSLTMEGKEEVIPLLILKVESAKRKKELELLIATLYPSADYGYASRQYNGKKIFDVRKNNGQDAFSYSYADGLFLASQAALVVEKSIRQLDSESLPDNELFQKVRKTATGQAEASVYVNHSFFREVLKPVMNASTFSKKDEFGEVSQLNYKERVEGFSGFAAWSELDLFTSDEDIRLSGVSVAPDSLNQYLTVFKNQDPVRGKIDRMMPRHTAFYFSLAFSKKENFFKDLDTYFSHSDVFYKREERFKRIDSEVRASLKPVFEDLVDDEIALVVSEISGDGAESTTFFIVSVKANSEARERLLGWLQQYASKKNIDFGQLASTYQMDRETRFMIYAFPYPSFPGIWLGAPFYTASAAYFAFRDNYILFCSNRTSLENLLHDLTLGVTLTEEAAYAEYKKELETKANINYYLDINHAYHATQPLFSESLISFFKEKEEALRKFSVLNGQVVRSGELLFNNILLRYSEEIEEDAQTMWQSNIGSAIDFKPQMVINHDDPGNREIILQDRSNRLHLITDEGRVRWSLNIPEKILGEIHQIDFFRNGKLQFLFNTKDKMYLIDRLGNHVSPFPIALRSPATNGLNVFDYDNNRTYRYFLAGEDKKIYVYDRSGKIVSGWKFEGTDHEVTMPVQHFRVAGKDYIVFKDTSRIYVQHRRGDTRIRFAVNFENSRNPILLKTEGTPKMVTTDNKGRVYYLYFDGSHKCIETGGFSPGHFFTADDLNGDGSLEFIFIDRNKLVVMDEKGKGVFSKEFRNEITCPPNIYTFSSVLKKIGVAVKAENRIYLYNPDGSLHQGFPLQGNSEFTIGKMRDGVSYLTLIVGSHNGNIYNYRLD
jgi:hypothetical protein